MTAAFVTVGVAHANIIAPGISGIGASPRCVLPFGLLGFVDRGADAQELVGQAPRRMTMDLTLLTVEQERVRVASPGSDFKECANGCPVMIVIPGGRRHVRVRFDTLGFRVARTLTP